MTSLTICIGCGLVAEHDDNEAQGLQCACGESHPVNTEDEDGCTEEQLAGSFGAPYLYMLVPRVILFRPEHDPRILVRKVDFVSAPGSSPPEVYRPGGPAALITGRCLFDWDKARRRFRLRSVHPGQTPEGVRAATGFDYDAPEIVPTTIEPDAATRDLIRTVIREDIAESYSRFAAEYRG